MVISPSAKEERIFKGLKALNTQKSVISNDKAILPTQIEEWLKSKYSNIICIRRINVSE